MLWVISAIFNARGSTHPYKTLQNRSVIRRQHDHRFKEVFYVFSLTNFALLLGVRVSKLMRAKH